jgi:hypothetical protein
MAACIKGHVTEAGVVFFRLQVRLGATEWVVKRRFRRFLVLSEELRDIMTGSPKHSSLEVPSLPLQLLPEFGCAEVDSFARSLPASHAFSCRSVF